MSYTWFKLHHELPDDIKVRRFTPQEKWAWVVLLCLASKSSERGVITADDEDIAEYCEFNTTQDWLYFRDKLISKGMLEHDASGNLHVLHWEDRQYEKPSDHPEAVKRRVRKHRAKKKELKKDDETTCNALQTPRNGNETPQIRSDPDPDPDPYFLNPDREGGEKKQDPFLSQAGASEVKTFLCPRPNEWNRQALKVWAKLWRDSGREPGEEFLNLISYIRKRWNPGHPDHENFLDEVAIVRRKLDHAIASPPAAVTELPPPSFSEGVVRW